MSMWTGSFRDEQELKTKEVINNRELFININWSVISIEKLEQIIKAVDKIQKEYSCNCTLFVKSEY